MKKKLLISILVLGLCAGCGKVATLSNGDEAVVSFTNSELSVSANALYSEIKNTALTKLIDMMDKNILLDKYPDESANAKSYAEEQFTSIKKYYVDDDGKYDESKLLEDVYSYYGVNTISDFKEILKLAYYRNLAIEDYAKDQITDKELENYYNENVFGDIACKHILIAPETNDNMSSNEKKEAEKKALNEAKDIIKKLNDGADFSELAKEYSDDTGSAKNGGDLGTVKKDELVSEFWDGLVNLETGKYSDKPVKSQFGYHIILKTSEGERPSFEDKKDDIKKELATNKLTNDSSISVNALVELRKSYGMEFQDDSLKELYTNYISNQLLNASNQNK